MKTVLAVRHLGFEHLGVWDAALADFGFEIFYCDPTQDDLDAADAIEPDLLVILGAPIGAYDDDLYPFLTAEVRLIERRLAARQPLLGICLGAQLIARALGARVAPMAEKEIGFSPLQLTEAGVTSPLGHIEDWPVLHWHGDQFDMPEGSTLLASTEKCPHQAFAIGSHVLGLQCHLEADAREIESWLVGHCAELIASGRDPRAIRADAAQYGPGLETRAARVLRSWIAAWE